MITLPYDVTCALLICIEGCDEDTVFYNQLVNNEHQTIRSITPQELTWCHNQQKLGYTHALLSENYNTLVQVHAKEDSYRVFGSSYHCTIVDSGSHPGEIEFLYLVRQFDSWGHYRSLWETLKPVAKRYGWYKPLTVGE